MTKVRAVFFYSAALLSFIVLFWGDTIYIQMRPRAYTEEMKDAAALSAKWLKFINEEKGKRGISNGTANGSGGILGDEFTPTTTTVGSEEAKRLSGNPLWAALAVRFLKETNIRKGDAVGLIISGSFPSLAVHALAALQTVGVKAVIISSLGASSFGANQPGALWIDMENWLRERGGLRYRSQLITYGAEGDTGGGLQDEARGIFAASLKRTGNSVFIPATIEESIHSKLALLQRENVKTLINIGGNQTALGYCSHAETLPNGLWKAGIACNHPERGVLSRFSGTGGRVIHFINLTNLGARFGILEEAQHDSRVLHLEARPNKSLLFLLMCLIGILVYFSSSRRAAMEE